VSTVSFILPVRNEQRWIAQTLRNLRAHVPAGLDYEIIVVDNGSLDRTREIADEFGVDLLLQTRGTVAAVRNTGVRRARGEVLVFLDGDVMLTSAWRDRFTATCARLRADPRCVTGSTVRVPEHPTWIEKQWFARQQQRAHTHINSGHLITSRSLFDQLGGFCEGLETGEDYDFCVRARALGATIENDAALPAIHEGFPKTLRNFFRRELWLG
jgi:glycosyltransferase involved in cell wall biosynthesis